MDNTQETLLSQLSNLRQLFAESMPDDPKVITNYAWIIVKVLLQHTDEVDSVTARQLLADCLKLPIERPSQLYSALLSAAVKVANAYPEFRFAAFLRLWNISNMRQEDNERQRMAAPQPASSMTKSFPSLVERAAKALAHSLMLHPEDRAVLSDPIFRKLLDLYGLTISQLLVTRIKQATGKDGRKYTFVTLTSPEGNEMECVSNVLQPSPLHPLPEGKRHYVNIGQLYDVVLRQKSATVPASAIVPVGSSQVKSATVPVGSSQVKSATVPSELSQAKSATVPSELSLVINAAALSQQRATDIFPSAIGYIEGIDSEHGHMHVYDYHSRHFVAPVQRFSREKVGDFVRFIPITPATSKFKTAIILTTVPSASSEVQSILREIRITTVNKEKGYAAWELTDKEHPITELLSPLQLSEGETSPCFTSGYLNLATMAPSAPVPEESSSVQTPPIPDGLPSGVLRALIYLKRGKDRQKRPHVAKLF